MLAPCTHTYRPARAGWPIARLDAVKKQRCVTSIGGKAVILPFRCFARNGLLRRIALSITGQDIKRPGANSSVIYKLTNYNFFNSILAYGITEAKIMIPLYWS